MMLSRPIEWRPRGTHRPCIVQLCNNDSSDRYEVPLCQEHVLAIWVMVDKDMREQGITSDEVVREHREQDAARAKANLDAAPGHIYYLELGEYLKIGYTKDLWRRIHEYPPNAVLLAQHEGTREDEKRLHDQFAAFRDSGREWYLDVPEIREHIAQIPDGPLVREVRKKRRSDPTPPKPRKSSSRTRAF